MSDETSMRRRWENALAGMRSATDRVRELECELDDVRDALAKAGECTARLEMELQEKREQVVEAVLEGLCIDSDERDPYRAAEVIRQHFAEETDLAVREVESGNARLSRCDELIAKGIAELKEKLEALENGERVQRLVRRVQELEKRAATAETDLELGDTDNGGDRA